MTTVVNTSYQIDITSGADEYSLVRVIGQRTEETRRQLRNATWIWSKANQRVLFEWSEEWQLIPVDDVVFARQFDATAVVSLGRTRLELITEAENARIRLDVLARPGLGSLGVVTNTHAGILRNQQIGTVTGITTQNVLLRIDARRDNVGLAADLFSIRVQELHILSADL